MAVDVAGSTGVGAPPDDDFRQRLRALRLLRLPQSRASDPRLVADSIVSGAELGDGVGDGLGDGLADLSFFSGQSPRAFFLLWRRQARPGGSSPGCGVGDADALGSGEMLGSTDGDAEASAFFLPRE